MSSITDIHSTVHNLLQEVEELEEGGVDDWKGYILEQVWSLLEITEDKLEVLLMEEAAGKAVERLEEALKPKKPNLRLIKMNGKRTNL